jgi:hypothetical protein
MRSLRCLVVLVDHAAEYLPPPNRQAERSTSLGALVGWPLLTGLVRSVPVVVVGVAAED